LGKLTGSIFGGQAFMLDHRWWNG